MGKKNGEDKRGLKFLFWNIAGLKKKDNLFWDYVKKFDFVGLTDIWILEREWNKLNDVCQRNFSEFARDKKRKTQGESKRWNHNRSEERYKRNRTGGDRNGRKLTVNKKRWRICTIFSRGMRNTKQGIQEKIEESEEEFLLLGGDFNARIGNKRREEDGETHENRKIK
ncbi:hypothetical protein Zmor_028221 [Zophobas morio]|uniref:Endonuclease/exonuclease/phosphatase domain-containing protein n=1 Tax=Zophobas morio TaxID=2755281 RepID=A0AA38HSE7_9CUCU|nr:hypothetical protein Zmor_028221 [Zophobas morio]